MVFLFDRLKLVAEPSGAVGVAALLAGTVDAHDGIGRRDPLGRERRRGALRRAGQLDCSRPRRLISKNVFSAAATSASPAGSRSSTQPVSSSSMPP